VSHWAVKPALTRFSRLESIPTKFDIEVLDIEEVIQNSPLNYSKLKEGATGWSVTGLEHQGI